MSPFYHFTSATIREPLQANEVKQCGATRPAHSAVSRGHQWGREGTSFIHCTFLGTGTVCSSWRDAFRNGQLLGRKRDRQQLQRLILVHSGYRPSPQATLSLHSLSVSAVTPFASTLSTWLTPQNAVRGKGPVSFFPNIVLSTRTFTPRV